MMKWILLEGESFGEAIKRARQTLGMTQKEVAKRSGVGPIYISRIENDSVKIPSDRVCIKLAEVLGLDPKKAFQFALWLKTPTEFRKFLPDTDNNNPLAETVGDPIREVVNHPVIKRMLIELSSTDLSSEVISRFLKSWSEIFVETLKVLKGTPEKNEGVYS